MKRWSKVIVMGAAVLIALAVTGVSVTADVPPQPNGACVFRDGSCQITPQGICNQFKRATWLGPDTTCP